MDSFKLTGQSELDKKIQQWLDWDQHEPTRTQIISLCEQKNLNKLTSLFSERLKFGTAGIRGRMEAGISRLNDLIVIQTCQGLAQFLLKHAQPHQGISYCDETSVRSRGIVIGYDGRHNSQRFAERAAAVFTLAQIKVYLYSRPVSTPFVPFGVRSLSCVAGLMVTASHNPKHDNGMKVYLANGGQILDPWDKHIQAEIEKNLKPIDEVWTISTKTTCPLAQVHKAYLKLIRESVFDISLLQGQALDTVRFTYTSLHGVGHPYLTSAFQEIGLQPGRNVFPVSEQQEPDPEFSTVTFPNPEEGAGVLDLAVKTALKNQCQIIIANDPDTDRCCIAEMQSDGQFRQFTGNEIGALLAWWTWYKHGPPRVGEKCVMLSSTVSSHILERMGEIEGFEYKQTLTGFKWMGNIADDLMRTDPSVKVMFAFEEAIGFMCNTKILDKDGISAAIELAQLCLFVYSTRSCKLSQFLLNEVWAKYGYHFNVNSYYLCHQPEITKKIFERIFHYKPDCSEISYPEKFGEFEVTRIVDLTNGYDSAKPDHKPDLPSSSSSFMITFYFKKQNAWVTLRTSGTEPKIKFYSEIFSLPNDSNHLLVEQTLRSIVQALVQECLQPDKNGLKSAAAN